MSVQLETVFALTAGTAIAGIGAIPTVLGQVGATTTSFETLLPQLGVFGVVVVLFKFMLNRQDDRDEKTEKRDADNRRQLQFAIEDLRRELAQERAAHEETRRKLIETLTEGNS